MKKIQAIGIGIIVLSLLACSIGLVTADEGSEEYVVIDAPLSSVRGDDVSPAYPIPAGSVIYSSADGITTVYTPDGKIVLKARDSDAAKVPTSIGMVPATKVHKYPSGSYGSREPIEFYTEDRGVITENATKYYAPGGTLLLTIITEKGATGEKMGGIKGKHSGWIECANDTGQDLDLFEFTAYWDCPSTPPEPHWNTGDLLFNAIQEYYGGITIMHPILYWDTRNGQWIAYAQWIDPQGHVHETEYALIVDEGDKLRGQLTYDWPSLKWYIEIWDMDTGWAVGIYTTPLVAGATELDIFAALECYNVTNYKDVPGHTTFYDMSFSYEGNPVDVEWGEYIDPAAQQILPCLDVDVVSDSEVKLFTPVCGDVNLDGVVTPSGDAMRIKAWFNGIPVPIHCLWAADVTGDGEVNPSGDAMRIEAWFNGIPVPLNCCEGCEL